MSQGSTQFLDCPACGKSFAASETALQICPVCGHQFFLQDEVEAAYDDEAREAMEKRLGREREKLDQRHIRAIQLDRRSIYRNRTWVLVLAFTCIGLAGQLAWLGAWWFVEKQRGGYDRPINVPRGIAYFVIAGCLAIFSVWFFRKARRLREAAEQTLIPEPESEPDFEPLSDGSQFASHLSELASSPNDRAINHEEHEGHEEGKRQS